MCLPLMILSKASSFFSMQFFNTHKKEILAKFSLQAKYKLALLIDFANKTKHFLNIDL